MAIIKGDQVRMTQLCIAQLAANKQEVFFTAFAQAGFQAIVSAVTEAGVSIHPPQQANVVVTLQSQHIESLLEKVEVTSPVQNNPNMDPASAAHPFDLKHTPLPVVQAYHLMTYFSHARDRLVLQACEQYRFKSALQMQTLAARGGSELEMTLATAPFEINLGGEEQLLANQAHSMLNDYLSLTYEVVRHRLLTELEMAERQPRPQVPIMTTGVTQLEPIVAPVEPVAPAVDSFPDPVVRAGKRTSKKQAKQS